LLRNPNVAIFFFAEGDNSRKTLGNLSGHAVPVRIGSQVLVNGKTVHLGTSRNLSDLPTLLANRDARTDNFSF
jgi:hypothetical protein